MRENTTGCSLLHTWLLKIATAQIEFCRFLIPVHIL